MLDLRAPLIPGKSAAGFFIGQRMDEVKKFIGDSPKWNQESDHPFLAVLRDSKGWISHGYDNLTIEELVFGNNLIRLQFNGAGILYNIFVDAGYEGLVWGEVKIGDKLSTVLRWCDLEYGPGDDMHYPVSDGAEFQGIAFGAEDCPLEESPDQVIDMVSIHDWSLQD